MNKFNLQSLAKDWEKTFSDLIQDIKTNPLTPYQPTPKYTKRRLIDKSLVKLNIACGPSVFPFDGWINYDHANFNQYFDFMRNVSHSTGMPDHQRQLWQYVQDGGEINYIQHNMTQPFPHADNSVDIIYVGQAIEHLSYFKQAPAFIKECHRMLKPGGILRMSTPDFNKLLNAYEADKMDQFADDQPAFYKDLDNTSQLAVILFGASGDNCTQTNYEGHFFCYTCKSMTKLLNQSGFTNILYTEPEHSLSPIVKDEVVDYGYNHSLIVEATK